MFGLLLLAFGSLPLEAQSASVPATQSGSALATIRGSVFDSLALAPLAGAYIQILAATDPSDLRTVRADSAGNYVVDSVPVGDYLVALIHQQVDRLSLDGMVFRVAVVSGGEVDLPLGLPGPERYRNSRCGAATGETNNGVFVGFIRNADGEPLAMPARIRSQFNQTTISNSGIVRRRPLQIVEAHNGGVFTICGLPAGGTITTRAFAGNDSSDVVELEVPPNGVLVRDMYVGRARRVATGGQGLSSVLRGSNRLRGLVRDSAGRPLEGARVSIASAGSEAVSGSTGQFVLDSLPAGTWMLTARSVGFEPRQVAVDVLKDPLATAQISLTAATTVVDTVKVRANAVDAGMAGFEQRRKTGFGYYYDTEALKQRSARTVADFLRTTPGVTITPGMNGRDQVTLRGITSSSGRCIPAVFIDGAKVAVPDGVIDDVINQNDVRALEVYTGTASIPLEFQTNTGCGAVVLWSGGRLGSDRRNR